MEQLARLVFLATAAFALFGGAASAQDEAAEGEKVFKRTCITCHTITKDGPKRLGPTLFGVIGRKTGSIEGFRYSEANKNVNIVWTPATLEPYLEDPKKVIPGTIMAFAGLKKADDRQRVIAYLSTLK